LYPLTSIWTNYVPQHRTAIGNAIESDFNYLTDTLLRLHFDFDYVDEDVLAEAVIAEGKIRIAGEEYSVLILPPTTHIKERTFSALQRFVKAGGSVIADTLLPVEFLETERTGAPRMVKDLFGVDPVGLMNDFERFEKGAFSVVHRQLKGQTYLLKGKGLSVHRPKEKLRALLNSCIIPDVTISHEDVFYLHRVKDEHDIYFLVNTSRQNLEAVKVTFERPGKPELWDPTTGNVTPIHTYAVERGRVVVEIDFPPSESRIVVLSGDANVPHVVRTNLNVESFDGEVLRGSSDGSGTLFADVFTGTATKNCKAKAQKPLAVISTKRDLSFHTEGDNALLIGGWRMCIEEGDGVKSGYHEAGFDDNAWLQVTNGAWEMQLEHERDSATYPVALWYRAEFHVESLPNELRLVIDGFSGSSHRLFVNGREILENGKRSSLDAEMKEVTITPFVQRGRNVVAVRLVGVRRTDGILDLLKILGEFAVVKSNGDYVIAESKHMLRIGDWTKQGYPFFSGTGVYKAETFVSSRYRGGRFFLEAECGEDVLEVIVNGSPALVAPWHPYRFDVTNWIRAGLNTIEFKVTNTLINLLEGIEKPSGLFAAPRLVHEHRYELSVGKKQKSL